MTEKLIECVIRGVVESDSLKELIPILQSYSCPHLKSSLFLVQDNEYFTGQTRMTILQRYEYSIEIDAISKEILSDQESLAKLSATAPTSYLYQEGRSLIGNSTVRSRRQSIVLGNIAKFLHNFDITLRRNWEFVGCRIELLGGIKVSILQPIQKEQNHQQHSPQTSAHSSTSTSSSSSSSNKRMENNPPSCYVIEISCVSSESNITLASEKVSTMANTLSSFVKLSSES